MYLNQGLIRDGKFFARENHITWVLNNLGPIIQSKEGMFLNPKAKITRNKWVFTRKNISAYSIVNLSAMIISFQLQHYLGQSGIISRV